MEVGDVCQSELGSHWVPGLGRGKARCQASWVQEALWACTNVMTPRLSPRAWGQQGITAPSQGFGPMPVSVRPLLLCVGTVAWGKDIGSGSGKPRVRLPLCVL